MALALAPRSFAAPGGYWMAAAAGASLYLAYRAYGGSRTHRGQQRHVQEMSDLHLATIEALALAIDAKDEIGQRHVRRMQVYAEGIARELGMSETEIQGVKTASLLHDIGKLAVPEHILSKPGPLTQEEFQKIRIHPQVGAEIIGGVAFPYPVAPLILCHHERWDGNGYPSGLAGEAIPLGARILSVVDYFDALITDRPYQQGRSRPMPRSTCCDTKAGKRSTPTSSTTFVTRVSRAVRRGGSQPGALAALESVDVRPPSPAADAASTRRPGRPSVFHDIALAHREIYALYEIAQAMGSSLGVADTMALISSKLSSLVPFSCCALFLRVDEVGTMRCRFATGVDAEIMQQLTVRDGQGLVGWVARNRRPLINARPAADLEAAGDGDRPTVLQSDARLPARVQRSIHRHPGGLSHRRRRSTPTITGGCSTAFRNRRPPSSTTRSCSSRRRTDSLTDPLTGLPNTRYMFLHLARELARAERARTRKCRCSSWISTGSRTSTTPTGITSATARCARSPRRSSPPSGRTTSASATRATNSSSCWRAAAPRKPKRSGWTSSERSTTCGSR